MNAQKVLLAAVVGGVTLFVLGYLIWGMALMSFMEANSGSAMGVMKDPPTWWALGVGQLGGGLLLAYVFDQWAGISGLSAGLKAGAIFGLLIAIADGFTTLGVTNIPTLNSTIVDLFASAVYFGIGGAVVGVMLGRGGASTATAAT